MLCKSKGMSTESVDLVRLVLKAAVVSGELKADAAERIKANLDGAVHMSARGTCEWSVLVMQTARGVLAVRSYALFYVKAWDKFVVCMYV